MPYSIPWYVVAFVSIPETFLYLLLGFQLYNLEMNKKKLFFLSILNALVSYILRKLPILFGIHTLVLLIILALASVVVYKIRFQYAFIAVLTGILLLGIIQGMTIPIIFNITELNMTDLASRPWLNILFFIPSGLIMALMYFFIKRYKFVLYNFENN